MVIRKKMIKYLKVLLLIVLACLDIRLVNDYLSEILSMLLFAALIFVALKKWIEHEEAKDSKNIDDMKK